MPEPAIMQVQLVGLEEVVDFRAAELTQWRWILYPWAVVEDVGQFIRDMEPPATGGDEIRQRLLDDYGLGLSPSQLRRVLHFNRLVPQPPRPDSPAAGSRDGGNGATPNHRQ
ncbi:MAG: hypothetical protein U5S82_09235 [Gammaproteobacteria bacterium]|nr:hypothetical protein [Gammaproteobacteria bacterium]